MGRLVNEIRSRIRNTYEVPMMYFIVYALSFKSYLVHFFKRDLTVVNSQYDGANILLLALFEKFELRKDIVRLLEAAKKQGLYVIAVNTRKLSSANLDICKDLINVYIEQYNYGRDFGSYQKGFKYIFKNGLNNSANRIIMLNDSLYYDSERLPVFLNEMSGSDVDALGATENHEINYHLGSFAISFGKKITTNKKFIAYWHDYRKTDIRPKVIKRGEMGLSKLLLRISSNEYGVKALYDAKAIRSFLEISFDNLVKFADLYRDSKLLPWPTLSHTSLLREFLSRNRLVTLSIDDDEGKAANNNLRIERSNFSSNDIYATSFDAIKLVLEKLNTKQEGILEKFKEFSVNQSVANSRVGSQIHQNAAGLLLIGLPLIKIDGLYRGMFSEVDIGNYKKVLSSRNYYELIEVLYKKPFGGDVLHGWKSCAFLRGLI
jgi:hypothetical protein